MRNFEIGSTQHTNVDNAELTKFGALANRWWDPSGPQRALHVLNPVRLKFINDRAPLNKKRALDVGCGAGLLSEALAASGAEVTALDLSKEVIEIAQLHLLESGLKVDYRLQSVESLADEQPQSVDIITCMEMLEHVPDPGSVISACHRLLKPGGSLFVSTLNRTSAAFALAIVGAEYVAGIVPKGTHEYVKFIKPSELAACFREIGFELQDLQGLQYNPLNHTAHLGGHTQVNYILHAVKA
jgi:2-polyprenyl-6-hydroxyphenyl methylase / 3-demethylubiquinone-9 3-methyltransferase